MTYNFDTLALHAGQVPDETFGARAAPIYLTTSFVFKDSDQAAALFNMERAGHVYSRISNPTNAVLEERIAALEGGVGAIAVASGQAALHLAIATLMGAGGHIVASRSLYGGSHNLLDYTLPRFGITTTFVDPRDLDAWRAAIRPETRLLFGETLGNPGLDVLNIPEVAALAHRSRPAAAGGQHLHHALADASLRSRRRPDLPFRHQVPRWPRRRHRRPAGRWRHVRLGQVRQISDPDRALRGLSRHGFQRGIDRRRLPAAGAPRGPARLRRLHEPAHRLPVAAGRGDPAAAHGAPHRQHAQAVAHLAASEAVAGVAYPELENHPDHALAQKLLPRGAGSVFSFTLKGGRPAGRKFIEALRVFSHLANVGDAKSLVIHPASTTHFRMSDAALVAAGIHPGTIRLSIGLEDGGDLLEDLNRGLAAAAKA
jgi:O-acetylhomoserine (thiol)-lyase